MSGTVHVDVDDGICTITIDNPEKRNALSPSFLPTIAETLASFDGEEVRAVVFTATGTDAFSSGYDISEFDDSEESGGGDSFRETIESVSEFPYPTIAMINGDAIGGGFEFVTACDLRIAVEGARFGVPAARLGIVYDERGVARFIDALGPMDTKEILFSGELLTTERTAEMGFLTDVVPREELQERTYELARTIADNAPLSLSGTKRIVNAILDHRSTLPESELEWIHRLQREAFESRDHQEAIEAFAENRKPEFEGR